MAKNDKKKVQSAIDTTNQRANTSLDQLKNNTIQPEHNEFANNYRNAVTTNTGNYGDVMQGFKDQAAKPGATFNSNTYAGDPNLTSAASGYKNFADTGGYSGQDIQDIRARGVSPLRAAYANATSELNRNKSLSGGYSPNFAAATAKMARERGMGLADANTNINAGLADSIRQGKLAGLSGMTGIGTTEAGLRQQNNQFNTTGQFNAQNTENNRQAGLLAGQTSLYGTTPGMAGTFGNQVLDSSGQMIDTQKVGNQQGQAQVGQQIDSTQVPSNFETGLGRVGNIAKIGSGIINPFLNSTKPVPNPLDPSTSFRAGLAM